MPTATDTAPDYDYDYGGDALPDAQAAAEAFTKLDALAREASQLAAEIAFAETSLETKRSALNHIVTRALPELLATMKLDALTTSSGLKVEMRRVIRASLPSAKERPDERAQAIAWLIANGHGGIVKNKITVALDRGEDARADELTSSLRGAGFDPALDKDVHAQTLSALVRELLTDGKAVEMKLLGVFDGKVATVKRK